MKEAIHSPVVLDVAGLALEADDRRRLAHPLTGGVILFARNWRDRRQLTDLVAEIKALRPDVLVCVDHEGGRVQRFRSDGFTQLPAGERGLGHRPHQVVNRAHLAEVEGLQWNQMVFNRIV